MDTKQEIINEYLLGNSGYRQLAKKYSMGSTTLHRWVQKFQGFTPIKRAVKNEVILPDMKQGKKEKLSKDVIELQQQLAQERLRNKLLTAIIDVAEEELKIPIRKKYGTKPLKK